VALEYAQKAQGVPEGTTPATNEVKVLVEALAALKTTPGADTPRDVEEERKKLVELTRKTAGWTGGRNVTMCWSGDLVPLSLRSVDEAGGPGGRGPNAPQRTCLG
jgi:hypothetical protein